MVFNVQASNYSKQPVENSIILPASNMNILSIKADIDANRRGYLMTGSFTVLKTPPDRDVDKTVDISFRNGEILSPSANYTQANVQAIRNDNNSINELENGLYRSSR